MSVSTPTTTQQYVVTGMTCGHCVASVTEELSEVPGVTAVEVELSSGTVTVTSTRPLGAEEVAAAVTEAGYAVASGS